MGAVEYLSKILEELREKLALKGTLTVWHV